MTVLKPFEERPSMGDRLLLAVSVKRDVQVSSCSANNVVDPA